MHPPNDIRYFVHKRLIKAATGFITGGPTAAVSGFLTAPVSRSSTRGERARAGVAGASDQGCKRSKQTKRCIPPCVADAQGICRQPGSGFLGAVNLAAPATGGCPPLMKPHPVTGVCQFALGSAVGIDPTGVGEAVMGRYGAALVPGNRQISRAVCLPGMLVGNDGLCYNRGQITNKERMWPKGRRPLLTGGDMRAIQIAARAGKALERAQKRLQKIGLMKKPSRAAPRRITSGATDHHHHSS